VNNPVNSIGASSHLLGDISMLMNADVVASKDYLSVVPTQATTLNDLLRWRALNQAQRQAYTFLEYGEESERWTYGDLDRKARIVAAKLQEMGAEDQRVLLLYPPGLDFIAAFFGCLYAGAIAVPAPPPRVNKVSARVSSIIGDAEPIVALTTSALLPVIQRCLMEIPEAMGMSCLASDSLPEDLAKEWREPSFSIDALAFFQYTSGSTSTPKGVMVNHANLMSHFENFEQDMAHSDDSVIISWLPHFHDLGLVYGVLHGVYRGIPTYLMAPASFIQRPYDWLHAISRFKGTHTAAPNFAYDLCVRKISPELRDKLDLSRWEVALNGAEPVRAGTLLEFAEYFRPSGFRETTFSPAYGLAEATLKLTASRNGEAPTSCAVNPAALECNRVEDALEGRGKSRIIVGCGRPPADVKVTIADPETLTLCPPDTVGEIWVSGPCVARGYWRRPEDTERAFGARLVDTGDGPFLRTGDLGFMRDGQLYVTGRIKDVIIVAGRKHYPQDIELTVEQSHAAIRKGCCAAFSIEVDDEERAVVVAEVDRHFKSVTRKNEGKPPAAPASGRDDLGRPCGPNINSRPPVDRDEIIKAIRINVAESHELQLYKIILIKTGAVCKTSSGKIQRHACRNNFLSDNFELWG
jgi:acyl-CoA synthetase (AMP-forming)/AMP-acid ligase II